MSEISKLDRILIIKKIDAKTINIQINDNEMLISIVGEFDKNLKELEKLTKTNIFFRGNSITCKGKEENLRVFSVAIKFLVDKYILTKDNLEIAIDFLNKDTLQLKYKDNLGIDNLIRFSRKS